MMQNFVTGRFAKRKISYSFSLILISILGICCGDSLGQDRDNPFGTPGGNQANVELTSSFKLKPDSQFGQLFVQADIADGYHIYSLTQPKGGTLATKIKLELSKQYQITGDFIPDSPPHIDDSKAIYEVNVESHENRVIWTAPIKISDGVDATKLQIKLTATGQVCLKLCEQFSLNSTAKFSGYDDKIVVPKASNDETAAAEYIPKNSHVQFSAKIVNQKGASSQVNPGDTVRLEFSAKPTEGHHIYQYLETVTDEYQSATLFAFLPPEGWSVSKPTPSVEPYENKELAYFGHKDPVTFRFDISIPAEAAEENHEFEGVIGFQTCTDETCDAPTGLLFRMKIPVGVEPFQPQVNFIEEIKESVVRERVINGWSSETPVALGDNHSKAIEAVTPEQIKEMQSLYNPESKIKYIYYHEMDTIPVGAYVDGMERQPERQVTLYMAALGMFLGGIFLNLMPCVFPVLGLKVMGFVEQSGSDPKKIRMHGIVFSLGVFVSMWLLAGFILTMKTVFKYDVSWGQQLGNPYFMAGIVILLFLMGLNLAGVFEIGTSLTRVGGKVDQSKGYMSSFFTGILTTIVATPCTGPFLGAAMGFTFAQTLQVAMLLFTIFALGISFPYLVLCFFPSLINALPRPGNWMHTFKVIMAFAMFATCAFFLQTFGAQTGVDGLTWIIMAMVVIALAAFFYGTWSPAYVKPVNRYVFGWLLPALIMGVGVWMTYDASNQKNTATGDEMANGLKWNKWYPGKIEYSLKQKPKVIWSDYTAHWCLVCKANKKAVFTNARVQDRIKDLEVELIKVDNTSLPPEITVDLRRSDQAAIPVNIVYPPNYPEEPAILLTGPMTPWHALKIFDRMEVIQEKIASTASANTKLKQFGAK